MKRKAAVLLGCAVLLFAGSVIGQPSPAPEIERLRAAVRSAEPRSRNKALDQLATIPDPAALNAIIEALRDANDWVWPHAMKVLGGMKPLPPEARTALLNIADSPNASRRAILAETLGDVRPVEYETLMKLLRDKDAVVCFWAADALGRTGDPRAALRLIELLDDHACDTGAIQGLEKLGPTAEPALAAALDRPGVTGPQAATMVRLLIEVRGPSPRTAAWLAGLLENRGSPAEVRMAAAVGLAEAGPLDAGLADRLIALLEDEEISPQAEIALSRRGKDPRFDEALAAYRRRREEWERPARQVAKQKAILDGGNAEACMNALEKLAFTPDPGALEALAEATHHNNPDIAREAARLLRDEVNARNWEFAKAYLAAAGSRNPLVRATVGRLLEEMVCGDAELLLKISSDADATIRAGAAVALGGCADSRAKARLMELLSDADSAVRSSASRGLSSMGPATADMLLAALRDAPPAAREAAIELLGELRDPRAAAPLVGLLEDERTPATVAYTAGRALQRIGPTDPRILDRLTAVLSGRLNDKSWPRMSAVAEVLQTLDGERGAAALAAYHKREDRWIDKTAHLSPGDGDYCSVCARDRDCGAPFVCRLYRKLGTNHVEKRCAEKNDFTIVCHR